MGFRGQGVDGFGELEFRVQAYYSNVAMWAWNSRIRSVQ